MRFLKLSWLAGAALLFLAVPAAAARDDDVKVTGHVEIDLGDFDIVIEDTGDRYSDWENRSNRVYVEVLDGRRRHPYYFDSLPAALFVLREMYGTPRITEIGVPEYAGYRHEQHGHSGHGLIDGARAYYVWDYDSFSRGGLPLILAFRSYRDAQEELYYRDGEIMDFEELVWSLYRWAERDYDRIYWRGWDRDRWDNHTWNRVWDRRWDGWNWDRDRGWLQLNVDLDFNDGDGYWRHRDRDYYDRDHRYYDRDDRRRNRDGDGRYRDDGRGGSGTGSSEKRERDDSGGGSVRSGEGDGSSEKHTRDEDADNTNHSKARSRDDAGRTRDNDGQDSRDNGGRTRDNDGQDRDSGSGSAEKTRRNDSGGSKKTGDVKGKDNSNPDKDKSRSGDKSKDGEGSSEKHKKK